MAQRPPARRRDWLASLAAGIVTGAVVFAAMAGGAGAMPAHAAEDESSAVTVSAKDQDPDIENAPLPDLKVTVSQTKNLVAQGIRISWTGGKKSTPPSAGGNGGENFLQIFMCWGDDPDSAIPRPDRTTCAYGGTSAVGATRDAYRNYALAEVPEEDQQYTAANAISFLPPYTSIPFVSRSGKTVSSIKTDETTGKRSIDYSVDVNSNQYFTAYSTNEVPWAGSGNDGSGAVSFEVQTAVQSDGLGCGTPVTSGSTTTGADCWLVILPRGTTDNGAINITQSGLFAESWRHALAVKLGFQPVGSGCPTGQVERQLQGSELAAYAVASWQPVVCNKAGGSVYSLITQAESDAVSTAASVVDAPLALASYPLQTDGQDPLQYAPIALTGITVSIAIDRFPNPNDKTVPQNYRDAALSPFTKINLTPRLLAKLLTYSYRSALPTGADTRYLAAENPYNLTEDPDFLAVNDPEWKAQALTGAAIADIIVPQGRSDAARAVWAYIAADQDARDFLASKPDPSGMVVNPYYSTDAEINPNNVAFSLDREDFPKADPIEHTPANQGPINLITWRPYANDLGSVAYLTLRGDGQGPGLWDPIAIPPKYARASRMLPGNQRLIGLTDASAAARYQVVTASLRNPAGAFTDPSAAGMAAAAAAMTPVAPTGRVQLLDAASAQGKGAADAYPLTLPVYAAVDPTKLSSELRTSYADFIRYAVSEAAQTPGETAGALPKGYAPLPAEWVKSANAVAADIANGVGAIKPAPTPTPEPPDAVPAQTTNTQTTPASVPAAVVAAAPVQQQSAPAPAVTGAAAGALSGGTTPDDPETSTIAYAVPASIAGAAVFGLGAPLIGRMRRRI